MSQEKVLAKIKKCLALAKSSNAHEAATALRQAQALMEKHQIKAEAVTLSDVETAQRYAGKAMTPQKYHQALVQLIKRAFGVEAVYLVDWGETQIKFIGVESQAEVAAYAYDVLYRQLLKDRTAYLKTLKRYKRSNKTRKADLFALTWVKGVWEKVAAFVQTDDNKALIRQYMSETHKTAEPTKSRSHKVKAQDTDALYQGYKAGQKASLHHGMTGERQKRLGVEA